MPYSLEQSGSKFYVVGPNGRHSRRPLPKKRAEAQLRALYASEKESATAPAAVPFHGPNALLNTPGLGRAPRGWKRRRKEAAYTYGFKATGTPGEKIAPGVTRIRGNLCNVHGKYGPCDKADLSGKPDATKRDANRQSTDKQLGLMEDAAAALNDLADGKVVTDDGGLAKLGLAELNPDGSYRLTSSGKQLNTARNSGNIGNARNAMGSGQAQTAKRQEQADKKLAREQETAKKRTDTEARRQNAARDREQRRIQTEQRREQARADAEKRRQERDAQRQAQQNQPRPERPAPAPRQQTPKPDKAAEQAKQRAANRASVRTQMAASDTGLSPSGFDAFAAFADGGQLSPAYAKGFADMGLVEGTPARLTKAGEKVIKDIDAGNFRAAADGIGRATDDVAKRRAAEQPRKPAEPRRPPPGRAKRDVTTPTTKSFTVFKEASGRLRWITRTTTAFKDRDGEILSIAAIDKAVARMKATGIYGPLRYWHAGRMTPSDPKRPWGYGLDLGMCDTAIRIGRTLVESGTFYDDRVGYALAKKADDYETSPGFVYDEAWRQPDGTFTDLMILERSPVPVRYARASNLFTGFAVKEHQTMADQMTDAEIARRWEIFRKETGVDIATVERVDTARVTAEKSADTQRVAFKEATPVYTSPDGTQGIIQDGYFVALKAPMAPAVMVDAGTTEVADGLEEEAAVDDEGTLVDESGKFLDEITVGDLEALIARVIDSKVNVPTEMDQKMSAMGYERKTKEEQANAVVIEQLQAQIKEAQDKITALTSDAAQRPYRPSLDGQEPFNEATVEQRRKALAQKPTTGNPAEDAIIAWAEETAPIGINLNGTGFRPS